MTKESKNRTAFDTTGDYDGHYEPLLSGENEFGNDGFNSLILDSKNDTGQANMQGTNGNRGRPKVITDERLKVTFPTKISPALNVKLNNLKGYMSEFSETTSRISFNSVVDQLAESYIESQLPATKQKILREQINQDFEDLKK
ncbi:hypothetical protein [Enterococcus sp. HY326]|uniref:hypothetical protein n=1 Tax=Enterococcus sp. HY326 TaxID=2971265 RepID=UPI002240AEB4|nr:hypothetical protein [Enterococcus sp. HY326]